MLQPELWTFYLRAAWRPIHANHASVSRFRAEGFEWTAVLPSSLPANLKFLCQQILRAHQSFVSTRRT